MQMPVFQFRIELAMAVLCLGSIGSTPDLVADDSPLTAAELALVDQVQQHRIAAINQVIGSVIAIYGEEKQGGGSGVIIDPSGIGLTNHHVIMGAGTRGWGGLADGKMYRWKLIGTDPGGDVSIIQMEGRDDFPFAPLGDSDLVNPGDWSLAMGNPFVLTEDQSPTVTLGIVSGVKRYQPGAGKNQLVYGNCIQTDSSINPGNSGGPLFNLNGEVVGINGRGSFKERGRVNVGLGYAISSNQIKNFIPELLATKLVEHGTLDANFEDRDGKVLCSNVYEDSDLYKQGVRPGDVLLEFEGISITTANQFTNLICTLPEDWPAVLRIRNSKGAEKQVYTRLYGLPYNTKTPQPTAPPKDRERTPEEKERIKRAEDMQKLLSAKPGTVRHHDINANYASKFINGWTGKSNVNRQDDSKQVWEVVYQFPGQQDNESKISLSEDGKFVASLKSSGREQVFYWDGEQFEQHSDGEIKELSLVESKLTPIVLQAIGIMAANGVEVLDVFGKTLIDGSDRSNEQSTIRLKLTDEDGDPLFVWLSMDHIHTSEAVELVKIGAGLNCDQAPGGVIFDGWKSVDGLRVPDKLRLVRHLGEVTQQEYTLAGVSVSKWNDEWTKRKQASEALPGEPKK